MLMTIYEKIITDKLTILGIEKYKLTNMQDEWILKVVGLNSPTEYDSLLKAFSGFDVKYCSVRKGILFLKARYE
jgi:hypothetical protein